MKALYTLPVAFALVVLFGYYVGSATAEEPTSQPVAKKVAEDKPVMEQVSGVVQFFRDKNWRPAIAALITLLVFLWRRYAKSWVLVKIPAKHIPWVVALVGLVAALPASLTVTPFVWWRFILDGFIIGGEAVLLWSTVGKRVLPKVFGQPEDAKKLV